MKKRITSIAKSMVILSIGMIVGVAALYAYKKKYIPFKGKPTYASSNDEKFLDYLYDETLVSKKNLLYPASLDISTFRKRLGEISISDR